MSVIARIRSAAFVAFVVLSVLPRDASAASIVWDYSPATTGAAISNSGWSNGAAGQNFAEDFLFANSVTLSGIDIYSGSPWGSVGQAVTIRLWSDNTGTPGTLLNEILSVVSIVDTDGAVGDLTRKFASFPSINLLANTSYWIGMSGTNQELAQAGLTNPNAPDNLTMAQFAGTTFSHMTGTFVGDMAFRLYGSDVGPQQVVPEPSSILLFGTGAAAMVVAVRRRRKQQVQ